MADKGKKTDDYEVGYGKPPEAGKFQPGKSGNPSGKKKGKGLAQYILEVGETEKTFTINGVSVEMPANQALAKILYVEALKGKHQPAKIILDAHKSGLGEMPLGDGALMGAEEFEIALTHADWLKLIEDATGGHSNDDASE